MQINYTTTQLNSTGKYTHRCRKRPSFHLHFI